MNLYNSEGFSKFYFNEMLSFRIYSDKVKAFFVPFLKNSLFHLQQ